MKYAFAILLSVVLSLPAQAQTTRNQLSTYNNSNIKPNGVGAISGDIVNTMFNQVINGMGAIGDTNAWTGANTFSGTVSFPGIPNVQHGDAIPAAGQEYVNSSGFHAIAQ